MSLDDRELLAPSAWTPAVRHRLAEAFTRDGTARLEPALPEAFAVDCLRAMRAAEFRADQRVDPDEGYQVWRFDWDPAHGPDDSPCTDHPLCALGRAFQGAARRWLESVSGLALAAPELPFEAHRLGKGGFVDPISHTGAPTDRLPDGGLVDPISHAGAPTLMVLLHLATAPWPASWGAHDEVSAAREALDQGPSLVRPITLAPAWNALDLIDLRRLPWHRVPLLTRHVDAFRMTFRFREVAPHDLRR